MAISHFCIFLLAEVNESLYINRSYQVDIDWKDFVIHLVMSPLGNYVDGMTISYFCIFLLVDVNESLYMYRALYG